MTALKKGVVKASVKKVKVPSKVSVGSFDFVPKRTKKVI